MTSKAPVTVASPEALKVVNEPEAAVVDPIEVPSIAPPLISTVDKVEVPVAVRSVRVDSPVTSNVPDAVKSVVVVPPLAVNAPVNVVSTVIPSVVTVVSNPCSSVYVTTNLKLLSSSFLII